MDNVQNKELRHIKEKKMDNVQNKELGHIKAGIIFS